MSMCLFVVLNFGWQFEKNRKKTKDDTEFDLKTKKQQFSIIFMFSVSIIQGTFNKNFFLLVWNIFSKHHFYLTSLCMCGLRISNFFPLIIMMIMMNVEANDDDEILFVCLKKKNSEVKKMTRDWWIWFGKIIIIIRMRRRKNTLEKESWYYERDDDEKKLTAQNMLRIERCWCWWWWYNKNIFFKNESIRILYRFCVSFKNFSY